MERKEFFKVISIGSLGIISGFTILTSCENTTIPEDQTLLTKEGLYNIIENSKGWSFTSKKELFRTTRIVIFSESYEIYESKKDLMNREVDYILRVKSNGLLKCNFDIYQDSFEIIEYFSKDHITTIITKDRNQRILLSNLEKELHFPLKLDKSSTNIRLEKNTKIPCLMRKAEFIKSINNDQLSSILLNN